MLNKLMLHAGVMIALASPSLAYAQQKPSSAVDEVRAAETAFAKSMADRNLAAFTALLADDTVFWGGKGVNRGTSTPHFGRARLQSRIVVASGFSRPVERSPVDGTYFRPQLSILMSGAAST